jgi:hypothetical protein
MFLLPSCASLTCAKSHFYCKSLHQHSVFLVPDMPLQVYEIGCSYVHMIRKCMRHVYAYILYIQTVQDIDGGQQANIVLLN